MTAIAVLSFVGIFAALIVMGFIISTDEFRASSRDKAFYALFWCAYLVAAYKVFL